MNKQIKNFLLIFVLFFSSLALSACSISEDKPNFDLREAAKILEDNYGYIVYYEIADEYEPYLQQSLYVFDEDCNYEDYNYFFICEFSDTKTATLFYKNLKFEYEIEIKELENEIKELENEIEMYELTIEYYERIMDKYLNELYSTSITDYENEIADYEDSIKECKDMILDNKNEIENMEKNIALGMKGKYVWYGSIILLKDTKHK